MVCLFFNYFLKVSLSKGEYRSNGANKPKYKEYYRYDDLHKDIEIYDSKARYIGSKDPVNGKIYRLGNMKPNKTLERIIK